MAALRDDEHVRQHGRHQDLARLAVSEQASRVGEARAERDRARLVVEVGLDGLDDAGLVEELPVGHPELHGHGLPERVLRAVREILALAHVEIDPHLAVVREHGEEVSLLEEAAGPHHQPPDDPVERRIEAREAQVSLSEAPLRSCALEVRLRERELLGGHDVALSEAPCVLVLDLGRRHLGRGARQLRLVDDGRDLEEVLSVLHGLALVDEDVAQVAALERAHLDVPDRADLADVLVHDLGVLADDGRRVEHVRLFGLCRRLRAPRENQQGTQPERQGGARPSRERSHGAPLREQSSLHGPPHGTAPIGSGSAGRSAPCQPPPSA